MKAKWVRLAVVVGLLGSLTIQADPFKTWTWSDPTTYENGALIPDGDLAGRVLHCGMEEGGPYPATAIFDMQVSPSVEDMAFVVAGVPGTYYCVSTVDSLAWASTSGDSNEINFTVLSTDLGLTPNPPVLSLQ